ncbi:MAG TPA: replication-associated recombination protein A [Burkholderiales bacterium]|nr:replication-associated recombination protein A [Burkholderiales bacterium]
MNNPETGSLFARKEPQAPLADRLRPRTLEEFVGQDHLLGPGKPLRLAFEAGKPHSMILWGPPGVGKTTLARLMARAFDADFIAVSAVLAGVKDIRDAVARAELTLQQSGRRTILFVDEVHRFNKAQQDAFLPHVERGLLTFIGATTENPSFEVISALLSRAAVYVLQPLAPEELGRLFDRARDAALGGLQFSAAARALLLGSADGDARRLYNMMEQIGIAAEEAELSEVDETFVREALAQRLRRFDKGGDQFYDQISALHKSVRGSAPDAALYWLTRMLDGGADPLYLGRRLIRMAVEDIGLADLRALRVALDACETYERLGSPEGELALAEAALYMAIAPKSNAVYVAFGAAQDLVRGDASRPVPERLRNAPTRLMQELGYGRDYRYAHDEQGAYAAGENYFPEGMKQPEFYRPTDRGLEARIREHLERLRQLDAEARRKKRGE